MHLEKTDNNSMIIKYQNTDNVLQDICSIIDSAKDFAYQSVNMALVERNWFIGYRIAEEELKGNDRADYGKEHYLMNKLEFVKNPLIAEFLGFSLEDTYTETELETSIINNLQKFLMELRKRLCFCRKATAYTYEFYKEIKLKSRRKLYMDNELTNDREYMKQKMKTNHKSIQLLGENLRRDPNFIMEMVRDPDFKNPWALLKVVDKSLLTTEFVVEYCKVLNDRGIITPNTILNLNKILPEELRVGNNELWNELIKWGIVDHEILDKNHIELRKKQKLDKMMERVETITIEEFMKITNVINRGNEQFMLEVISRNPSLYVCSSEKLKKNADFIQRLIEKVPSVSTIVEEDEQKRKAEYEQKRRKSNEEAMQKARQKEEEKHRAEEEEKDRIIEEYKKLGENHPNLVLVNNFLEARVSKILFCKRNNIDLSKLDEAIKEVSIVYPEIGQRVGQKNKQSAAIHITTIESITKKLLSGEMTLKEYSREQYKGKKIDDLLLKIPDFNKRKQLHTLVVESIASGELTMMDYKRLFSEEYDYKTIMDNVSAYMQRASREMPELIGRNKPINTANIKLKNLKKYAKSYHKEDFLGTKRGWATPDGKMETTTITEEYIEYAKKYLRLEDEYICYATMNSAILKIIKGEVSFEDIDKRTTKAISMQSVVENAINNGTTMEDVTRVEDLPQKEETIIRE